MAQRSAKEPSSKQTRKTASPQQQKKKKNQAHNNNNNNKNVRSAVLSCVYLTLTREVNHFARNHRVIDVLCEVRMYYMVAVLITT